MSAYNESRDDRGQRYEVRYLDMWDSHVKTYGFTDDSDGAPYADLIAQTHGMGRPHIFDRRADKIAQRLAAHPDVLNDVNRLKTLEWNDLNRRMDGNTGVLSEPGKPIGEDQLDALDAYQPAYDGAHNARLAKYLRVLAAELELSNSRVHVVVEHVPNLSSPMTLIHVTRRGAPGMRMSRAEHQQLFVP